MLDVTPIFRKYTKYRMKRLAALDPAREQEGRLRSLLTEAAGTRFGKDHGFGRLPTIRDFQRATPLRVYEDFWDEYWKKSFPLLDNVSWPGRIPLFALTSGTSTGTTKYIPLSHRMNRQIQRGGLRVLVHHLANRPRSRILGGRSLMLGGSTDLREPAPGVLMGDLSGIAAGTTPPWGRRWTFPPREIALLTDWEEKIDRMARLSLTDDIRLVGGVPSWMLVFFKRVAEIAGIGNVRLARLYPDLELIVHGGVNFAPYLRQFEELMRGCHAETREVYPASEGFFAVADRGFGEGLRLILDQDIFFEFVPVEELKSANPTRHWIGDAELDVNYALVLSTCAGLWSYVIGDTVKFVDLSPPRILITGRVSYGMSAFGEHLTGEEIEDAVAVASRAAGIGVADFSMGAEYPGEGRELGGHVYWVEFEGTVPGPEVVAVFARIVDERLCERNEDYEAHRAGGYGLDAPRVEPVAPGTFRAWMKRRGKLGGQNKVPRVINDAKLLQDLKEFASAGGI